MRTRVGAPAALAALLVSVVVIGGLIRDAGAQAPTTAELLALRGRGIKNLSTNKLVLLGRAAPPSKSWEKLADACPNAAPCHIEYRTPDARNGRIIMLRCTSSCATESGVKIGMAQSEVERSYGTPKRTQRLGAPTAETFLLYDGIGFSMSGGSSRKVTAIYVFPYL